MSNIYFVKIAPSLSSISNIKNNETIIIGNKINKLNFVFFFIIYIIARVPHPLGWVSVLLKVTQLGYPIFVRKGFLTTQYKKDFLTTLKKNGRRGRLPFTNYIIKKSYGQFKAAPELNMKSTR